MSDKLYLVIESCVMHLIGHNQKINVLLTSIIKLFIFIQKKFSYHANSMMRKSNSKLEIYLVWFTDDKWISRIFSPYAFAS